jgi:DNA replication and repair protein RecF
VITYVERLAVTNFRNYAGASIEAGPAPIVLLGANGAGKTNILEAVSLLAAGQGMRRVAYPDLARQGGQGDWAVAARVIGVNGAIDIGTGQQPLPSSQVASATGRIVRVDGQTQAGSGVLADHVEMVWLIPAMDGLFTGPAGDRRRFLDRLILCFDPGYRTRAAAFERAMRQRNRLLADNVRDTGQFIGLERVMAETGVAIAAVRAEAVAGLAATFATRRARDPGSPFPWADISLDCALTRALATSAAVDVEDLYHRLMANGRERDRAAGRTLDGPHRADLVVAHGPKAMSARLGSTGEQKALLIGLVLAHAELLAVRRDGAAPILLLDEIAAHLDDLRRGALFDEIIRLGIQAWMTGTDRAPFAPLEGRARFFAVHDGQVAAG